jgi:hypothetical protein
MAFWMDLGWAKRTPPRLTAMSGGGRGAILPGPWVDGFEEYLMGGQHIGIGERIVLREPREGFIDAGGEGGVFKPPDDGRVFFLSQIPQIAARREVAERIESHGLASRKYCA